MKVAERARQLAAERTPFVHATVVRAQQPTPAHAGDEAILLADGTIEGFVGGHCAQNSVRKAALGALQSRESVLLRVLPDGDLHFPEAPGAAVVVNPCLSGGALEIFLEPNLPAPLIRIHGATPIADALAQLCEFLGFGVDRGDADTHADATAVIIAGLGGDEGTAIRAALDSGVSYIGLVASRIRGASILDQLELGAVERACVHTPVGLPIGSKTSAEIALSIAAELVHAIRNGIVVPPERPMPVALEVTDPVCGMSVVVGPDTPHAQADGVDHWFCSPGCRMSFVTAKASS